MFTQSFSEISALLERIAAKEHKFKVGDNVVVSTMGLPDQPGCIIATWAGSQEEKISGKYGLMKFRVQLDPGFTCSGTTWVYDTSLRYDGDDELTAPTTITGLVPKSLKVDKYVKRVKDTPVTCANGEIVPGEALGLVGIVTSFKSNGAFVKFATYISLGPFGPIQGVDTLIPFDDLKSITAAEYTKGIQEEAATPQTTYCYMGKDYPLAQYPPPGM